MAGKVAFATRLAVSMGLLGVGMGIAGLFAIIGAPPVIPKPVLAAAFIVGFAGAELLGALTIASLSRRLRELGDGMRSTKQGERDLTTRLAIRNKDEIGAVSRQFNIFLAALHDIVFRLKTVAREGRQISTNLAANTAQISAAVEEMFATIGSVQSNGRHLDTAVKESDGSVRRIQGLIEQVGAKIDDQSSAIIQSSAVIDQMVASIQSITNIAESKSSLTETLSLLATNGREDMRNTLESIAEISSSVELVHDLLVVIDDVAKQTNLLSMNAAIEAAHAGDAGKGFAIVAEQIKRLSETTKEHSTTIGANIDRIVKLIKTASALSEKTGGSIAKLTDGIEEVAGSVREMTGGLSEMSKGTAEISGALGAIVETSNHVRDSSSEIRKLSSDIVSSAENASRLSGQNDSSLQEMAAGFSEITGAISFIRTLGSQNADYMGIIESETRSFKTIDKASLKSSDGRSLLSWEKSVKDIPVRPADPTLYPKDDDLRWWDKEYAGWNAVKTNIPEPDADGPAGKRVVALLCRKGHPYYEAVKRGMKRMADAYGINLRIAESSWNADEQEAQVEGAISSRCDLIILASCDNERGKTWFRKINEAGIPVIASILQPDDETFRHILCYTGSDEWGSVRLLAKTLAAGLGDGGGYACVQHLPDSIFFESRTYPLITELRKLSPGSKCLALGSGSQDAEKTKALVAEWIARFGTGLKGIMSCDDRMTLKGVVEAVHRSGRDDITIVACGHSEEGLRLLETGEVAAVTMKSAETEGALPMDAAVEYFNGLAVQPIKYLPIGIITKETVEQFRPAQY